MERMTNTLLPAKYSTLLPLFLWKRIKKGQRRRVNTTFSVVLTEGNWKLYGNGVLTEWNSAGDREPTLIFSP